MVSQKISSQVERAANFVRFERGIAAFCALIPLFVLIGDHWNHRDSISDYYNMTAAPFFYYPLSVASMLFMVNGVVRDRHWFNIVLGVALAGVVWFNTNDRHLIHVICASTFFFGNFIVFLFLPLRRDLWLKIELPILFALGLAGWYFFHAYTLFWAEAISLVAIAIHFVLEAGGERRQTRRDPAVTMGV